MYPIHNSLVEHLEGYSRDRISLVYDFQKQLIFARVCKLVHVVQTSPYPGFALVKKES